ncbi:MAG: hypothetical protein K8R36_01900 [Planctomycetales bacterium]|nr:hypothetical protein [Planctomycetales bacterium]
MNGIQSMGDDRRVRLKRKAHRPLVAAFVKLLARQGVAAIDVEMFWPPDDDAIHFRAEADKRDAEWKFLIPTDHWKLSTDSSDELPEELFREIKHLFRAAWKEANAKIRGPRGYLRFHDSTSCIDLNTGREIWDRDRPDYVEPGRRPFSREGHSTKKSRRNGELVHRGDPLSAVKKAYKTTEEPDTERSQYFWPECGIRIEIRDGKVRLLVYFDPFPDCVCGIWIGAHAWEVDQILGRAKAESFISTGRLWQYDLDGFMSVGFDPQDRVRSIGR